MNDIESCNIVLYVSFTHISHVVMIHVNIFVLFIYSILFVCVHIYIYIHTYISIIYIHTYISIIYTYVYFHIRISSIMHLKNRCRR